MSRTLKGRMTRVALPLLFCLACARGRTLPPDRALGVVLGKVFNPSAFTQATCVSARAFAFRRGVEDLAKDNAQGDRKSTRLNSSHLGISYAVFCLKKKKL